MDNYLKSIYYNTSKPGSYSGITKFWQSIKASGNPHKLKFKDVKKWLTEQYTYLVHKQPTSRFKRESIIVGGMNEIMDTDLMDVQKFSRSNDRVKYLAVFIDLFSRYLRIEPMKSKTGEEMVNVMKKIFKDGRTVKELRSDQGKEYTAKSVQEYMKSKNINHVLAYNVYHANYAERVIRTVKARIYKFFTKHQTHRYIEHLQEIVTSYNNTKHSTIGMAPSQVTDENQQDLYEKIYLPIELKRERTTVVYQFNTGDKVRLSLARVHFQKGFDRKWTEEIFIIDKRIASHPPRYRVIDLNKEKVDGSFYEQEMQRAMVTDNDLYKIEKVLRHRIRQGKREALVRWLGYSKKFDSWIKAAEIRKYG